MAGVEYTNRDWALRWTGMIAGSLLFSFPFYWLVITSWKGERELFRFPPDLVPELAVPAQTSPYIHPSMFAEPGVDHEREERSRIESAMIARAGDVLRASGVEPEGRWDLNDARLQRQLLNGIWTAVLPSVPETVWEGAIEEQTEAIVARMDEQRVLSAWNRIRKEFLIGPVNVVTADGIEHRLEPVADWQVTDGCGVETVVRSDEPFSRICYDFNKTGPIRLTRTYRGPALNEDLFYWSIRFGYDLSNHRAQIRLTGADYDLRAEGAVWLDSDQFYEVTMHRPEVRGDVYDYDLIPSVDTVDSAAVDAGELRVSVTLDPSNAVMRNYGKLSRNYRMALSAFPFNKFIWNSIYLVVLNIIGQLLACGLIAYSFARLRWPGRDICFLVLLSTMMLPPQVTTVPVFLVFKELGFYNTLVPLWLPSFFGAPFFIFLLRQFFLGIPRDLEEAAHIDGCGYVRTFVTIMIPLIRPALAAIAIFQFMNTWNDFFGPLIYTNEIDLAPLPLGLFIFRSSVQGQDFGMLMAVTTVMTLPVIAIFFFAQRYFIQGITLTGLKG